MPKMVVHSHTYPLGHYITGAYWHDLNPGDLHLTLADTGWAKTQWGKYYGQWLAGAAIFTWDFRGKFEADELLDMIQNHKDHHFLRTSHCVPLSDSSGCRKMGLSRCATAQLLASC